MMTPSIEESVSQQTNGLGGTSSPDDLQRLKLTLEAKKLDLENRAAEMKLLGQEKPTRWEVARTLITWLGVIVPLSISIFTYLHQREVQLKQERTSAIQRALELLGDPRTRPSGILQLSLYGDDTLPLILGEMSIPSPGSGDDEFRASMAAISALELVGIKKLKPAQLEYLRAQGDLAARQIRVVINTPEGPTPVDIGRAIAPDWVELLAALSKVTGGKPEWEKVIADYRAYVQREKNTSQLNTSVTSTDGRTVTNCWVNSVGGRTCQDVQVEPDVTQAGAGQHLGGIAEGSSPSAAPQITSAAHSGGEISTSVLPEPFAFDVVADGNDAWLGADCDGETLQNGFIGAHQPIHLIARDECRLRIRNDNPVRIQHDGYTHVVEPRTAVQHLTIDRVFLAAIRK